METYVINGVDVQYDTFDLVNLELYDAEVKRVAGDAKRIDPDALTGSNAMGYVREVCDSILDFFDTLCGDGTSARCFGNRVNVKILLEAYQKFILDVNEAAGSLDMRLDAAPTVPVADPPANRELRRAAEREGRRKEARERAKARQKQEKVTVLAD